jgi:hypothetical protein
MNIAQFLQTFMGVARGGMSSKVAHGAKNSSHTKTGPGRYHVQGDGSRTTEQKRAGAFGRGLRNNITRKNAALYAAKAGV